MRYKNCCLPFSPTALQHPNSGFGLPGGRNCPFTSVLNLCDTTTSRDKYNLVSTGMFPSLPGERRRVSGCRYCLERCQVPPRGAGDHARGGRRCWESVRVRSHTTTDGKERNPNQSLQDHVWSRICHQEWRKTVPRPYRLLRYSRGVVVERRDDGHPARYRHVPWWNM